MSKLIQMRTRIKTIETIKKITHAMRLISMSSHSRMKAQQEPLTIYIQTLTELLAKVQHATPEWSHERLMPQKEQTRNNLIIFIGSQKGLCGNFNTQLIKLFTEFLAQQKTDKLQFIAVGKKAVDYLQSNYSDQLIEKVPTLSARNFIGIAQHITGALMTTESIYTSVTVISNIFKSFFVQEPTITQLIPFDPHTITAKIEPPSEGYMWDEEAKEILNNLAVQYIETQLHYLLFQSLLSEHAARFISMDSSTRNANNLLEVTKLEYNKLRQAKITTEITELTGSF